MALQTTTDQYKRRKNASIFMFDDSEPRSLEDKRQYVYDSIFGDGNASTGQQPPEDQYDIRQQRQEATESASSNQQAKNSDENTMPATINNGRQRVLDSLAGQKLDPTNYTITQPTRPTYDSKKHNRAKNLTKTAAIAQGIDAIVGAIGAATNEDYAVAPANFNQLGIEAYNTLANMDIERRRELANYRQQVFDTRKYNQQARNEVRKFNTSVDTQVAQQELQWAMEDEQAIAAAQEAKDQAQQETKLAEKEAYIEAGNRLITQGQERAAMVALSQAGLPTEEIAGVLRTQNDNTDEPKSDPTIQNMVNRFNALEGELSQNDYGPEGSPISPKAKEYEYLKEELGRERYNPLYNSKEDNGNKPNPELSLVSESNRRAMQRGLNADDVREGLNSPASIASENRDLIQQARTASSQTGQRAAVAKLFENWESQGLTLEQQNQAFDELFGAPENNANGSRSQSSKSSTQNRSQQSSSQSPQQAQATPEQTVAEVNEMMNQLQNKQGELSEQDMQDLQQLEQYKNEARRIQRDVDGQQRRGELMNYLSDSISTWWAGVKDRATFSDEERMQEINRRRDAGKPWEHLLKRDSLF